MAKRLKRPVKRRLPAQQRKMLSAIFPGLKWTLSKDGLPMTTIRLPKQMGEATPLRAYVVGGKK